MQPNRWFLNVLALLLILVGLAVIIKTAFLGHEQEGLAYTAGGGLVVLGLACAFGLAVKQANIGKVFQVDFQQVQETYYRESNEIKAAVTKRTLDPETQAKKVEIAVEVRKTQVIPGESAPEFDVVSQSSAAESLVRPSAYPLTPMYLLDKDYRIIDWNLAFTIAFDRTMEGRKGRAVLEWTYYLDNYEAVLQHGVQAFGDPQNLPKIDVEAVHYTSQRYGQLTATKRAYQIPDDSGSCLAWLVTLDTQFLDPKEGLRFKQDLIRLLGLDLMWSEYAISYDRVLNNTKIYPALLNCLAGGDGMTKIGDQARVIDLGAGTGNLTNKLMKTGPNRLVFAAENNRIMLDMLRAKCKPYLREDPNAGGVIAFKQDISSLFGLQEEYFDYALMNNVLYALEDPKSCLRETCRILKRGGELRLSGPRKDTKIEVVFERIYDDLKAMGKDQELQAEYQQVWQINKLKLQPLLYQWTTKEVEDMVLAAGFSEVTFRSDTEYAGQAMVVGARK